MRIKHFAGYGSVNARKLGKTEINGTCNLTVEITGLHEWGLTRPFHDPHLIYNWIVKRYDKRDIDITSIGYTCNDGYKNVNGTFTEYAVYSINYELK